MKPTWESECGRVKAWNADAGEVLPSLPAACVSSVVTDPPYNVGLKYASGSDSRPDYARWCKRWLAELDRVCDGPILISCGMDNLRLWCRLRQPHWVFSWWKPASAKRCTVGFNNWEPVLYYGAKTIRNVCDVVRTTEQASLPARHKKEAIAHPCPKPIEWAVKFAAMTTGTILDPFMGSGTTGIAAVRAGRCFIGIEKEPSYFEIAVARIEAALASSKQEALYA